MRKAAQEAKILRYKIFAPRNFKIYRQNAGALKFRRAEFQNLACTDKILRNFIDAMPHRLQS
ncbi:hypothetical protein CAMGR0001_2566 [Campylobacter gracilis RM3268]|uniref:Uncharacterized protein n=1 Tax=Campylobacter gracilis RM3268 TaxID=553220 RepID=C8PES7_9BACT|nr:hypothetical protein CAMGR0001_2566 [Campylobacter gracilis RM3268]